MVDCYSQLMDSRPPDHVATEPKREDPRRNLFWLFISVMGISMPKPGNERRAMMLVILGAVLFLVLVAIGILTLFRFW
jgi:hypothetical protein